MSSPKVLVTGANGHIGFRVLISSLEQGYTVRAAVRRQEAAAQIKAAKSVQPYLQKLEIVFVEDILADSAFDAAVVGVDYVLHIASPVSRPSTDFYNDFIAPAVQGTVGLLKSALKEPSIKRVVITSSMAVLNLDLGRPLEATDLAPVPAKDASFPSVFAAYAGSKKIALEEASKFVEQSKPSFDVIHILPSVVLGKNELVTSKSDFSSGTNRYVMNIALGVDAAGPMIGATVHVNDVADIHVQALKPSVKGNQNFITSGGSVFWVDVNDIVKKEFSKEVKAGTISLQGKMDTKELTLNTSKTEEQFGVKWTPFVAQVKDVVGHYLSLA